MFGCRAMKLEAAADVTSKPAPEIPEGEGSVAQVHSILPYQCWTRL